MAATVHAAIVQVRAVTQIGGSALVPNSTSVGPVQVLTENTASTIVAAVHDRSSAYTVPFDAQTANLAVNDTLTFSGGGTATLVSVVDAGATGTITFKMLAGSVPANNETFTGAPSTGDGTVDGTPALDYGDVSSSPEYMVWEITNFGPDNIYVAFGTTPDATEVAVTNSASTAKRAVAAGTTRWFGVAKLGDKVEYVLA